MTRNLKALGLALLAVFAIGVLAAQGASAAENHQFHADGERANGTGKAVGAHEFAVGSAGTVKCTTLSAEGTEVFNATADPNTWERDTVTAAPMYSGCTFGGNPATVNFEHCAVIAESDTTAGNTTGGEHANLTLQCSPGHSVKITTSICTLTVGAQEIKHAVSYRNDPENASAVEVIATAHNIVVGNLNDKAGCALVPKGAVGKYIGTATVTCFKDIAPGPLSDTNRTTPTGLLEHGSETNCQIKKGTAS